MRTIQHYSDHGAIEYADLSDPPLSAAHGVFSRRAALGGMAGAAAAGFALSGARFASAAPSRTTLAYGASEISFAALNAQVGGKLKIRRSYDGALPTSISMSKASADLSAGRLPWVSFSSVAAAPIRSFMDSCAAAKRTIWITPIHEVNNGPKMGGPEFADLLGRLSAAKNAAGATLLKIAPIVTAVAFRTEDYKTYFVDPAHYDIIGIDPYRFWRPAGAPPDPKAGNLGQSRTMQYLIGSAPTFSTSVQRPIAIGEYGAHPFPEDHLNRSSWLTETDTFLKSIGSVGVCYFHSGNGESGPWWVDRYHFATGGHSVGDPDAESLAKFKALVSATPAATASWWPM